MNRTLMAATLIVASSWARTVAAEDTKNLSSPRLDPGSPRCARRLDEQTVVRCALAASPDVRRARAELDAIAGRRATASVILPSNPTLAGTLSSRRRPAPEATSVVNWSVALQQEVEIAGQRGARVDVVDAQSTAQLRRVGVAEQEVAAGALTAYYEAIAAQESVRFAGELARTAETLAVYAEARVKEALVAGVEGDVARAEATRIGLVRFEAERRLGESRSALGILLDAEPRALVLPEALAAVVPTEIEDGALETQALRLRGELGAAEMERQVLEGRLALVRRERVPNPTLSAFWERGEINDRIIGVGLSIPLSLPAPVGRTRAGEIAETLAQIRVAESSEELVRRRVRLEVARALSTFHARQGAAGLFTSEQIKRARVDLSAIREAIGARQLPLREGLQWQRSLIELLQSDIETRLDRALAWVELRRVAALPLAPLQGAGQ
jgi:cobalt-zinc-cadmium efflux system outer membrane protein